MNKREWIKDIMNGKEMNIWERMNKREWIKENE